MKQRKLSTKQSQVIARDTLIEHLPDGVLVVDLENRIIDINPAALRLFDLDRETVTGVPVEMALAPWKRLVEQFISISQIQTELTTLDEPPRHFHLQIAPLQTRKGDLIGRLIVIREVTELKLASHTLHQRIAELTTVNSITQTLAEEIDLAKMIQSAGDKVREILNAQGFYIALYDSHLGMISFPYWRSMIQQFQIAPIHFGKGLASHVIATRRPLVIDSNYAERSEALGVVRPLKGQALGLPISWLGVPMIVGDQVIGMVSAQNFERENAFDETDLQLWTTIAASLGTAIRNAQLYAETQRAAEQMTALNHLSLAISEGLGMDRLLPTLHQQCKKIAPFDIFYVALLDQAAQETRIAFWDDGTQTISAPAQGSQFVTLYNDFIIQLRQTIYISDTHKPDQTLPELDISPESNPVRSFLGMPLVLRDQVIGVISALSHVQNAFMPQQIDLFELFAIQAAMAVQNSQLYEQVQTLAVTDELTHLPNRRALFEKGEYEITRARRFNHPFSVIMLDIDHFKQVNDRHGHDAGDRVLRQIADSFQGSLRATDLAARYGGEEFVVLLPETSEILAAQIAERLRTQAADRAFRVNGEILHITVSLGIASLGQDTLDFSKLVSRADQALYQSKREGRNRATIWIGEFSS